MATLLPSLSSDDERDPPDEEEEESDDEAEVDKSFQFGGILVSSPKRDVFR